MSLAFYSISDVCHFCYLYHVTVDAKRRRHSHLIRDVCHFYYLYQVTMDKKGSSLAFDTSYTHVIIPVMATLWTLVWILQCHLVITSMRCTFVWCIVIVIWNQWYQYIYPNDFNVGNSVMQTKKLIAVKMTSWMSPRSLTQQYRWHWGVWLCRVSKILNFYTKMV